MKHISKIMFFLLLLLLVNPVIADTSDDYAIEVNIAATRLYLYKNNQLVQTFPVAVGAPGFPTPIQSFELSQIIWNPGWFPPDSPWAKNAKPIPPGPNNPLGPVKFPLADAVLIHGTNQPGSIGYAASHGCIRMNSQDAATLGKYLQSELLPNKTENWENSFSKVRWKTVWLTLPQKISVNTTYQTHKIIHDELQLFRNPYGKKENFLDSIVNYLIDHKIYTANLNYQKIKDVRKSSKQIPRIIPLDEFYSIPELPEPLFAGMCCTNKISHDNVY